MSIPTPFNPMGTLGGGDIERLEFVTVDGTTATANEDLVAAALGTGYFIEPSGSAGYYAEVECSEITGTYSGHSGAGLASIGSYTSKPGEAFCYLYGDTGAIYGGGYNQNSYLAIVKNWSTPPNGGWYKMRIEENTIFVESYWVSAGSKTSQSWAKEDTNRKRIYVVRTSGLSYRFHGLKVVTESQSFEAAPARKGGKDGIAFYIDGKFESFLEL